MEQARPDLDVYLRAAVNGTIPVLQCALKLGQIQTTLQQARSTSLGLVQMGRTRFGQMVQSINSSPCDLRVDTANIFMDVTVYEMTKAHLLELTKILVTKYTPVFTGGAPVGEGGAGGAPVGESDVGAVAITIVTALAKLDSARAATQAAKLKKRGLAEKHQAITEAKEAAEQELARAEQDEDHAETACIAAVDEELKALTDLRKSIKRPRDSA